MRGGEKRFTRENELYKIYSTYDNERLQERTLLLDLRLVGTLGCKKDIEFRDQDTNLCNWKRSSNALNDLAFNSSVIDLSLFMPPIPLILITF